MKVGCSTKLTWHGDNGYRGAIDIVFISGGNGYVGNKSIDK